MKTNIKAAAHYKTHEGRKATKLSNAMELRRATMACLLWEGTFYEDGQEIAKRIWDLVGKTAPAEIAAIAIEAREKMFIRHAPLLIVAAMCQYASHRPFVEDTLYRIIKRPDEMGEFLAIYWRNGRKPIAAAAKRALRRAFGKFNGYQLAKYNSQNADIKLLDVMRIVHPKPANNDQEALWGRLKNDTLVSPGTWENLLSAGEDKATAFTRLINEGNLGGLAYLRNLRNMMQAGMNKKFVGDGLAKANMRLVLPWRFIAAALAVPSWEDIIEPVMLKQCDGIPKLPGKTVLLIDVSGSMDEPMAQRREKYRKPFTMRRKDGALGLAILAREVCEEVEIYSFSHDAVLVPPRRGFALRDAIDRSQAHGGTYMAKAISSINNRTGYDRIIVFTDEQSHDGIAQPLPGTKAYVINVSSDTYGVAYGQWQNVTGFSQATLAWIAMSEGGNVFVEDEDDE